VQIISLLQHLWFTIYKCLLSSTSLNMPSDSKGRREKNSVPGARRIKCRRLKVNSVTTVLFTKLSYSEFSHL